MDVAVRSNASNIVLKSTKNSVMVGNSYIPLINLSTFRKVVGLNTTRITIETYLPPTSDTNPLVISLLAEQNIQRAQPIYITNNGTLALADMSHPSEGVAINGINLGDQCSYISEGHVVRDNWLSLIGENELRKGKIYFLSGTGLLSHIPPTSGLIQQIGVAASAYMLDVELKQAVILAD